MGWRIDEKVYKQRDWDRQIGKKRQKQGKTEREVRDRETWRIRDREERQGKNRKPDRRSRHKKRQRNGGRYREIFSFSKGPWVPGVDQVSEPRMVGQSLSSLCPIQGSQSRGGTSAADNLEVPAVVPKWQT